MFIVLYADNILLISPSVCMFEKLVQICEFELDQIDMVINVKKSCCLSIGPRNDVSCDAIRTSSGVAIPWVNELRYLGIFIVRSRNFKCSLTNMLRNHSIGQLMPYLEQELSSS